MQPISLPIRCRSLVTSIHSMIFGPELCFTTELFQSDVPFGVDSDFTNLLLADFVTKLLITQRLGETHPELSISMAGHDIGRLLGGALLSTNIVIS